MIKMLICSHPNLEVSNKDISPTRTYFPTNNECLGLISGVNSSLVRCQANEREVFDRVRQRQILITLPDMTTSAVRAAATWLAMIRLPYRDMIFCFVLHTYTSPSMQAVHPLLFSFFFRLYKRCRMFQHSRVNLDSHGRSCTCLQFSDSESDLEIQK